MNRLGDRQVLRDRCPHCRLVDYLPAEPRCSMCWVRDNLPTDLGECRRGFGGHWVAGAPLLAGWEHVLTWNRAHRRLVRCRVGAHVSGAEWCGVVQNASMASRSRGARQQAKAHRLSISLTRDQYDALQELAEKNNVTLAWLARYALDQLLQQTGAGQQPLPLRST